MFNTRTSTDYELQHNFVQIGMLTRHDGLYKSASGYLAHSREDRSWSIWSQIGYMCRVLPRVFNFTVLSHGRHVRNEGDAQPCTINRRFSPLLHHNIYICCPFFLS